MKEHGKKKLIAVWCCVAFVFAFAGCTSKAERLEAQNTYRSAGIESLNALNYTDAVNSFNQALEQVKKIGANEIDICYYKAAAQQAAGDLTGALATYDLLIEYDGQNADVYFLRAGVYLKNQQQELALADYTTALELKNELKMVQEIYLNLQAYGLSEQGLLYLKQSVKEIKPKTGEELKALGDIYLILEDKQQAITAYERAIAKDYSQANLDLANIYTTQGDSEKANEYIDAYIAANPESSVAYNALGVKKVQEKDYPNAITYFTQGLALDQVTNEQELRSNLIAAHEAAGDFASAKTLMEQYVTDYPEDEKAAREWLFLQTR